MNLNYVAKFLFNYGLIATCFKLRSILISKILTISFILFVASIYSELLELPEAGSEDACTALLPEQLRTSSEPATGLPHIYSNNE
jgi:hypothetical protein